MNEKTMNRIMCGAIAVIIITVSFLGGIFVGRESRSEFGKIADWLNTTIEKNSLYYEKLTDEDIENMFRGMGYGALQFGIGKYDKFYAFYTPSEMQAMLDSFEGNNVGFGFNFEMNDKKIVCRDVIGNTPAYHAGLRKYDWFKAVTIPMKNAKPDANGSPVRFDVTKYDVEQFYKLLSIPVEIPVVFELSHALGFEGETIVFESETIFVTISKTTYKASYASYYDEKDVPQLGSDTAIIRLQSFNELSAESFVQTIELFKADKRKHLILDMRDNGGGRLDECQKIAEYLLKSDQKKVTIGIEKSASGKETKLSTNHNHYAEMNFESIQVLANGNSASATELLMMAMQYYGSVDQIIGSNTYGKGIMQAFFQQGEYMVKLTVAQLYDLAGRTIQDIGIPADVQSTKPSLNYKNDEAVQLALDYIAEKTSQKAA